MHDHSFNQNDDKKNLLNSHSHHDEEEMKKRFNINVHSAYLHVLGDMLNSIGVIIAALLVNVSSGFWIADPICTYFFSIIVCATTWPVFKNCMQVLLEGTPDEIDSDALYEDILKIEDVNSIHDFHMWSITVGKPSLTLHVDSEKPLKVLC